MLDDDEDDQLRALSLNALTYFGNPAAQSRGRRVGAQGRKSEFPVAIPLGEEGGRRLSGKARRIAAHDRAPGKSTDTACSITRPVSRSSPSS